MLVSIGSLSTSFSDRMGGSWADSGSYVSAEVKLSDRHMESNESLLITMDDWRSALTHAGLQYTLPEFYQAGNSIVMVRISHRILAAFAEDRDLVEDDDSPQRTLGLRVYRWFHNMLHKKKLPSKGVIFFHDSESRLCRDIYDPTNF